MRSGARLAAGLALGLTMIVTLTVGFFWAVQRQSEANRQVIRTHQVLENLESAISLLKDAETGQRGFLLTGQDQYLDPYNAATKSIKQKLDAVGDLAKDNPAQHETLQRVRALTADKLAELAKTIQLRRDRGTEAARAEVLTGRGERIMDDIRAAVNSMEQEEQRLLAVFVPPRPRPPRKIPP